MLPAFDRIIQNVRYGVICYNPRPEEDMKRENGDIRAEGKKLPEEKPFSMELLNGIRGAVFDLDGTLVDSMPLHIAAWQETMAPYGIKVSPAWLMNHGGIPSRIVAEMLSSGREALLPDPLTLASVKTRNYRRRIHEIRVFPAMMAVLRHLKERGIPMAVGTGTQRQNAETIIAETILNDYIGEIVSEADIVKPKPDPETFLLAAERIGAVPEECAVFEDSPIGIAAGVSGNFITVRMISGKPATVLNPSPAGSGQLACGGLRASEAF